MFFILYFLSYLFYFLLLFYFYLILYCNSNLIDDIHGAFGRNKPCNVMLSFIKGQIKYACSLKKIIYSVSKAMVNHQTKTSG